MRFLAPACEAVARNDERNFMPPTKGQLIVIEGIDGSGKTTQIKLLMEKLRSLGKSVETFSFPRHGQQFFGVLVDQYLNNEFGDAVRLDPRLSSLLYACDRWEVKDLLDQWLTTGKTIILDRYVTSNMGHQLSKIEDKGTWNDFLNWLEDLEFNTFKIPRPDLVLYLSVAPEIVRQLLENRSSTGKEYINGNYDGLEKDFNHLKKAQSAYEYLCGKYSYWHKIDCLENNKLLTIEEVHHKVWETVKTVF